ncbi:MAG TPA: hypothetical protein VHK06_08105 [Candidatus Limnocylindria bacterium]|nr:hypothetical protein [Candidatus Limnocylindria bacterium]
MALIQPASVPGERLDEPRAAAVALRLAELMGVYRRPPDARLDRQLLEELAGAVAGSGIADRLALPAEGARARRRLALAVLEALEASPLPAAEIERLAAMLGLDRLATMAGASVPSLRRYARGERTTPDPVAQRIHFLARIVAVLRGSFNEFGVRRWFERARTALDGRAPADLLAGTWDPDDADPQRVRELAESLLA